MGLFDKKYCDVCGDKIGLLGNKKLEDGNLCKNCAKKLSPWFEGRRHATLDEVKKQLVYREENKKEVANFHVTRDLAASSYHVFIDDNQGKFAIAYDMDPETNPDIVRLDQVRSCRLVIDTREEEEYYKDNDGNNKSYYPPRYKYYYNYSMKIAVDSPWFDDMDFSLNNLSVREHERGRMLEFERLGAEITAALTANPMPQQGYAAPGYAAPGYGAPMGTVPQPPSTPQRVPAAEGQWRCSCGAMNSGKFCSSCGSPKPEAGPRQIRCDKCGWVNDDPNNVPKFCPMCGDPIDFKDMN